MNSPDMEAAFRDLTAAIDLGSSEPTPLDDTVQALLDHFLELLAAAGSIDLNDNDALSQRQALLTEKINRFISGSEKLAYDTEVIVQGGTIILMLDESEGGAEANFLDEDSQIYGRIGGLYVGPVPDESVFFGLKDKADSDEEWEDVPTIPFGLALVLDDPILSDGKGGAESIPEEVAICIPIHYSSLRLMKA
ncbi:MAG: hypothetical protein JWM00_360 [Candidatus Saccharibacteria bacterium]|nr:hypothetical protein [Candidatus Saccharibacteria bacterium]